MLSLRISSGVAQRGAPTPRTVGFLSAAKAIAAAGALVGAFALAGCNSAVNGNYYQDEAPDGLNNTNPSGTAFGKDNSGMLAKRLLTGAGILEPTKPPIAYTPRSPLVLPANTSTLPPPENKAALEQAAAKPWPTDPEKKAKLEAEAAVADPTQQLTAAMKSGQRATPDQVQAARIPGGGLNGNPYQTTKNDKPLSPDQLKSVKLNIADPDKGGKTVDVGDNPSRNYLIEPPPSYRVPASTAPMPTYKKNVFQVWNLQQDNSPQSRNPTVNGGNGTSNNSEYTCDPKSPGC